MLVGVEEHEQRLEHHLERVDILAVFGQGLDESLERVGCDRGWVLFGEAPEAEDGGATVFEEGCARQPPAKSADGVGGPLLGRRVGLENSHHLERVGDYDSMEDYEFGRCRVLRLQVLRLHG